MKLARFIAANSKQICAEWEAFAQAYVPVAGLMSVEERRDHIVGMLNSIDRETASSASSATTSATRSVPS